MAAHLRRDGYEQYCSSSSGLAHYRGVRFGVRVTPEACFPSVERVAAALQAALRRNGLRRVLLATNSVNEMELKQVRATPQRATPRGEEGRGR